jgi:hypothetical protein
MKKHLFIIACMFFAVLNIFAQPPVPLPKHIIAQPQANVKLLELSNVVVGKWHGARITQLPGAVNVDSVWLEIKKNGTLSFKHQKFEFNGPTEGTYSISKNKITISCIKFPFTHTLSGDWDITTGIISGNYIELREKDNTQPSYYIPGRNTGTFNLIKY